MKISECDFYHGMDLQCRANSTRNENIEKESFEFKKHLGEKYGYDFGVYGVDHEHNVIFAGEWV